MSHTRQLLLCAACANELSKVGDGSLIRLKTGHPASIDGDIDVLITGMGVFQTIYNLCNALRDGDYGMVLTAGIAGDYDIDRPLCKMFAVTQSIFADCGFEGYDGRFLPITGSIFLDANEFPFRDGYIYNEASEQLAIKRGLDTATVNTVCRTCTDPEHVDKMLQQFPADLETMESAAFGYVCARQHVNYAEIRCTSNHVVPKKQEKWQLEGALNALGSTLDGILKEICN